MRFTDVGVDYGDFNVFRGVTMEIVEGTIVSVVGPNGSGKTTLVRTLLGFVPVSSGKVEVFGKTPSDLRRSGLAAYLPQNGMYDPMFPVSVYDVVSMGRLSGKFLSERMNAEDARSITESMRLLDVENLASKHFGSLSGGQKQRALIARALASKPRLLVLDEPSAGLDIPSQNDLYPILRRIRDELGVTVLIVSHDVSMVSTVVDRMLLLNRTIHYYTVPGKGISSEMMDHIFGRNMKLLVHDGHCLGCEKCEKGER